MICETDDRVPLSENPLRGDTKQSLWRVCGCSCLVLKMEDRHARDYFLLFFHVCSQNRRVSPWGTDLLADRCRLASLLSPLWDSSRHAKGRRPIGRMRAVQARRTRVLYVISAADHRVLTATTAYENIEIVTRSHPDAFPSALSQKRKTQTKVHQGKVLPKVRHPPQIHKHPSSLRPGLRKMSRVWTHGSLLRGKTGTSSPPRLTPLV